MPDNLRAFSASAPLNKALFKQLFNNPVLKVAALLQFESKRAFGGDLGNPGYPSYPSHISISSH